MNFLGGNSTMAYALPEVQMEVSYSEICIVDRSLLWRDACVEGEECERKGACWAHPE